MNFYFFILNTFGGLTLEMSCTHFFGVGRAIYTYIDSRTKKGLRHLSTLRREKCVCKSPSTSKYDVNVLRELSYVLWFGT